MSKHGEAIDAVLALPLEKGKKGKRGEHEEPDGDEPEGDEEDGDEEVGGEALDELADVLGVEEEKREAFSEALRKVVEALK